MVRTAFLTPDHTRPNLLSQEGCWQGGSTESKPFTLPLDTFPEQAASFVNASDTLVVHAVVELEDPARAPTRAETKTNVAAAGMIKETRVRPTSGVAGKRKKKLKRFDDVAIRSSDAREKWYARACFAPCVV